MVSDHEQDIWMLGAVDTVVLNDPATDEPTFGNSFRTLAADNENRGVRDGRDEAVVLPARCARTG